MSPAAHDVYCQGAILVYDITSAKSLERLDTWHKELDKYDSEEGMVSHSQPITGQDLLTMDQ